MSQDIFDQRADGKAFAAAASLVPATVPQAQIACHQAQLIGYALSHHVPDMRRGFDILTSYGRWHVDAKPAAQMAELMRQHLMQQLETI
ncbi:hypothetical protein [Comamonas thiooxydans]|uniref:hypothetical protein n=1 Tax=Comamonas thiooxydans TaxID=363952 RepID=UPI0001BB14C9|nr:hypothetical protein [Comamonas thiooxydans]ACY32438.1 hypothetical protein CtCNB1_1692 [Comamonas thiooxydans]MDO1472668.1 hypothetical protein [Comamonas thiooxydans]